MAIKDNGGPLSIKKLIKTLTIRQFTNKEFVPMGAAMMGYDSIFAALTSMNQLVHVRNTDMMNIRSEEVIHMCASSI